MNISSYIKELILRNECIILPEFGGFETHYRPAYIDKNTGKLMPPSKEVRFRKDFKKDNGVLLNYIRGKEKLSEVEGRLSISEYISILQKKLSENGKVEIENIGILSKREDGEIYFTPIETENYLIDSFGLSEIKLPFEEKKSEEISQPAFDEPETSRSWKSLYFVTFLTVIITFLIIISVKTGFIDKIVGLTGLSLPEAKEEKTVFGKMKNAGQDTLSNKIGAEIDSNTSIKNALKYTEPDRKNEIRQQQPEPQNISGEKKYLIVAGSFKTMTFASKQADKLKRSGYETEIVKAKNGQFRVILNKYSDKDFALQELTKYRNDLGDNIWLWTDC